MKWLLLLALLCGTAHAAPACTPAPWGQGTKAVAGTNSVGAWAGWWCSDGYAVTIELYAVRWDAVTPEMRQDFAKLSDAANLALALADFQNRYWKLPITDPSIVDVWADDYPRLKATQPPAPVWRVAKNGSQTTRPMYLLLGSGPYTLGSADYNRATVGATCDCSKRVVNGSSTYCTVPPVTAAVALCAKQ